jgi:hypothetical protein
MKTVMENTSAAVQEFVNEFEQLLSQPVKAEPVVEPKVVQWNPEEIPIWNKQLERYMELMTSHETDEERAEFAELMNIVATDEEPQDLGFVISVIWAGKPTRYLTGLTKEACKRRAISYVRSLPRTASVNGMTKAQTIQYLQDL